MKFLVVLPLLVAASIALPYVPYMPPGWVNADTYDEFLEQVKEANAASGSKTTDGSKIASGTEAKKGENPEFCYLNIGFYQKQQICGCWIWDSQYVVTSARCVKDCSEGVASNVTVNFPQLSGKDAIMTIDKIWIPDGTTPAGSLAKYDKDGEATHHTITAGNIALIRLSANIPKILDMKDVKKAKLDPVSLSAADIISKHPAKEGWKFRACGVGVIGNKGERAKGLVCTNVNIVDTPDCKETFGATPQAYTPFGDQACIVWPDRDNNICVGDFGGPVYAYKLDAKDPTKIDVANQEVVCTLVASPNVRSNAQCLDGHITMCTLSTGPPGTLSDKNIPAWITAIITPPPATK